MKYNVTGRSNSVKLSLYMQHRLLLKLSERRHKIYTPKLHDTTAELQNSSIRRLTRPSQDRESEVKLIRAVPEECGSSSGMIVRIYHSTQFCRSHDRLFHTHLSLNSCKSTLSFSEERVSKKRTRNCNISADAFFQLTVINNLQKTPRTAH